MDPGPEVCLSPHVPSKSSERGGAQRLGGPAQLCQHSRGPRKMVSTPKTTAGTITRHWFVGMAGGMRQECRLGSEAPAGPRLKVYVSWAYVRLQQAGPPCCKGEEKASSLPSSSGVLWLTVLQVDSPLTPPAARQHFQNFLDPLFLGIAGVAARSGQEVPQDQNCVRRNVRVHLCHPPRCRAVSSRAQGGHGAVDAGLWGNREGTGPVEAEFWGRGGHGG